MKSKKPILNDGHTNIIFWTFCLLLVIAVSLFSSQAVKSHQNFTLPSQPNEQQPTIPTQTDSERSSEAKEEIYLPVIANDHLDSLDLPNDWNSYLNTHFGITISFPYSWTQQELSTNIVIFQSSKSTLNDMEYIPGGFVRFDFVDWQNSQIVSTSSSELTEDGHSSLKVLKSETFQLGNHSVLGKVVLGEIGMESDIPIKDYIIELQDLKLTIFAHCGADRGYFEQVEAVCNKVIEGLRFDD